MACNNFLFIIQQGGEKLGYTMEDLKDLIKKARTDHILEREEILLLLSSPEIDEILFAAADEVRKRYVGDGIHLRGLIEFSNFCRNNCCYCGLRRDNKNITRYRMDEDTIFATAEYAVQAMGLKTIVLQSGEDLYFDCEKLCGIIQLIKSLDVALTLSIGEKSFSEYRAYKEAGADRFLLRIETTDKDLYLQHDPQMSFENRIECIHNIGRSGLEVGTGILVGLPNQTLESYADDILFFKTIKADMVGIGPFIPHPNTPLRGAIGGSLQISLKIMALTRLLLPDINIPATTAMETIEKNGQIRALKAGANVIMPNITLPLYRQHYELYPGKSDIGYLPDNNLQKLIGTIHSIGRFVAEGYGFHQKLL